MTSQPQPNPLSSVLVLGGCGFLGTHIVRLLLQLTPLPTISVISRNPTTNLHAGVSYHSSDLSDAARITSLLHQLKPQVIIHASSPRYNSPPGILHTGNVVGTRVVLDAAQKIGCVKAFVYASSDAAMQPMTSAIPKIMTEENVILYTEGGGGDAYQTSKGVADAMVLGSNDDAGIRTACIRFGALYGEGDPYFIPDALLQLREGKQKVQVGRNETLREWVYIESCASAFVLAAEALLVGKGVDGGKVAGEAFLVSDGGAWAMYDFLRKVWREAGDMTRKEEVKVLPMWVVMCMLGVTEWVFWVGTLGLRKPAFGRADLRYVERGYWFDITKARERLGYRPVVGVDEGIRRAVAWGLEEERKKGAKESKGK